MAGGNNKSFLRNPVNFLQLHQVQVNLQPVGAAVIPAGPALIDLVSLDPNMPDMIGLEDYTQRNHGRRAVPISSYYLPAIYNNLSSINIGTVHDYMFTPNMTGCLFAAYGPNSQNLTIEHVNVRNQNAPVTIQGAAATILNANHPYFRILTPVALNPPHAAANHVTLYANNTCVIGVRDNTGWNFYYKPNPQTVAQL